MHWVSKFENGDSAGSIDSMELMKTRCGQQSSAGLCSVPLEAMWHTLCGLFTQSFSVRVGFEFP